MSIKSYLAGIVRAVLPFAVAEVETLVKTEVDRYVAPVVAGRIEAAVDREIETIVATIEPAPEPEKPAVPK